jgi:hypothetical protein
VQTRLECFHGHRGDGLTIMGDTGKSHSRSCTRSRWHHQPSRLGEEKGICDMNGGSKTTITRYTPNPTPGTVSTG